MKKEFRSLRPASSNVSDIKAVAQEAQANDILVFIDEIDHFSGAQQDYLLDFTETGTFDLIAATTGNPCHVLTPALVSRASIFQLEPHSLDDLRQVVGRAIAFLASHKDVDVHLDDDAMKQLTGRAGGDARRVLNALETLVLGSEPGSAFSITGAMVDEVYQASPLPFDCRGDYHYDTISLHQIDAWLGSGRHPLLAGPPDPFRGGSPFHCSPHSHPRLGGYRPG